MWRIDTFACTIAATLDESFWGGYKVWWMMTVEVMVLLQARLAESYLANVGTY